MNTTAAPFLPTSVMVLALALICDTGFASVAAISTVCSGVGANSDLIGSSG